MTARSFRFSTNIVGKDQALHSKKEWLPGSFRKTVSSKRWTQLAQDRFNSLTDLFSCHRSQIMESFFGRKQQIKL